MHSEAKTLAAASGDIDEEQPVGQQ